MKLCPRCLKNIGTANGDVHTCSPTDWARKMESRVAELEASLRDMVSIEPDRHRESMSYFPPHKEGCIWCHAKRLLNLI